MASMDVDEVISSGLRQNQSPPTSLEGYKPSFSEKDAQTPVETNQPNSSELSLLSRTVTLVLYCRPASIEAYRIWVDNLCTFETVEQRLTVACPGRDFAILQPHWGPNPYWTNADRHHLIGETCQTVYAVVKHPDMPYILGVLRTSQLDSPIALFKTTSNPLTISQAITVSYPEIDGHIESIIQFSDYVDMDDGDHVDDRLIDFHELSGPLVITTTDKPSSSFMVGSLYASFTPSSPKSMPTPSDALVPPFLQIIFVQSKLMAQRAYELPRLALQMIHLTNAILHLILSLSNEMKGTFEDAIASPGEDMSDLLQVAPILAQRFEGFLNTIDDIVRVLDSGDFNCDRVQPQLDQLYSTMCEEYPGSVVVRHSWSRFKTLAVLDREEAKAPAPYEMDTTTSNSPETVQPPYEMDTMMSNSPIDAPYDMDTTTSNSPKMAHTLDDMDSTRSSSPTDIPFAQRRSASPAQKVPKEPFDEVEHFTTLSPEKHIYTPSSSSQRTPLMTLDSPMSMNRFMTSHSGDTLASQSLVQQSLEADLRQNPANDPTSTVTKTRVHGGQGGAPPSSKKSRLRAAPSANSPVNTLSASPPRTLSNRSTLPDYMQNMMDNYSGNTPASQSAVRQYLEEDLKQHPAADLIYIERKPGVHGKRGGIVKAICRECDYEGTFQKAAEHVTSAHWKLSLWSCTVPNCTQAYHRKHDLERHHKGAHQIPTSRAARRVKPVIVPATTSADPGSPNNPSTSSLYSSGPYSTGTQSLSSGNSGGSSLYREPLSSASAVDGPLSYGSDPKHIFGLQSTPSTSTHASFPPEGQESGGRTARHGTDIQQPSSRSFNSSRFSFAPHRQTLPTIAASPSVGQYAPGMQRSTSAKLDLDEDSGSDDLEHRPY